MKQTFHLVMSLALAILLNVFLVGAHASALSSASHTMAGTKHSATSLNCMTLCASAAPYKDEELDTVEEDDGDNSPHPFYVDALHALVAIEKQHTQNALIATRFEPPPGYPAYILFSVFRA